jgi:hypothetical protein
MTIKLNHHPTRRTVITLLVTTGIVALNTRLLAKEQPVLTVYKDPSSGCCSSWARHMTAAGFTVTVMETANVGAAKARLGVPDKLGSCLTAEIGGYAIEGHVPAPAIMRLLREKPTAKGLAVPGMPAGAPGMNGTHQPYEVILFGDNGQKTYALYHGAQEIRALPMAKQGSAPRSTDLKQRVLWPFW